jgi:hypothetical protein
MNKPSGYYVNERNEIPFSGSPGILKKKGQDKNYEPEDFLPQLATSPKLADSVFSNPMP